MTWTAPEVNRGRVPFVGDERATLEGFLDWQRSTLMKKCAGLTGDQLVERACPPSNLSLLGLVRHMTDVERIWFRTRFAGEPVDRVYWREDRPDAAFEDVDPAQAEPALVGLTDECERVRKAVAGLPLDASYVDHRWGEVSLRWGYSHVIAEYARHNGHADLIRQRIDGRTGL